MFRMKSPSIDGKETVKTSVLSNLISYPPNPRGTDLGTLAVLSHVCKKVRLQQHLKFDNRKTDLQTNESYAYIPSVTLITSPPRT